MNDIFKPSIYQEAIFEHILKSPNNLCVEGVAGCGKTKTIEEVMKLLSKNKKPKLVLSFNKTIIKELKIKLFNLPCEAKTTHGFGFGLVRDNWDLSYIKITGGKKRIMKEKTKVQEVFANIVKKHRQFDKFFKVYNKNNISYSISEIIPYFKSYLYDVNITNLNIIIDKHSIEIKVKREHIGTFIELIKEILNDSKIKAKHIDFDDMLWLPIVNNMSLFRKYKYVFVDEAQDLNRNQLELIKRAGDENTKFVFIGDRNQSIYGFRSADSESIPNIIKEFNCDTLPLDITYRCPKSHVELAQKLVSNIKASPKAKEGIVEDIDKDELIRIIEKDDLILCRNNAPLIHLCETLYKNNIPFSYKNEIARNQHNDFINNLIDIIKKVEYTNIYEFKNNILDWKEKKLKRTTNMGIKMATRDSYDSLLVFCDNLNDNDMIEDLINEIESKLEYEEHKEGSVELSTIHGAKGIENERVFILYPELIPSPYCTQKWELIQEKNLKYVSITRSKDELYFIKGD